MNSTEMNSTEIISELRKIATYSTSKKEVCTQAADLIEGLQERYARCRENAEVLGEAAREYEKGLEEIKEAIRGECKYCAKNDTCKSRQGSHRYCWQWRGEK